MKFPKTPIFYIAILLAGLQAVGAQGKLFLSNTNGSVQGLLESAKPFEFILRVDSEYRQDQFGSNFRGGEVAINLRDGQVIYDGLCASTRYVAPNERGFPIYGTNLISISRCNGGTSGFLSAGDFNNDGIDDPAAYLAVSRITQASVVEPKRPDKVMLVSAPPSELPRPLGGFTSQGALLFYNIQTTAVRQYPLSQYFYSRVFGAGERNTFDRQIVEGTYRYLFPQVGLPNIPVPISINYFGGVDGFREVNNQKRGFRFLGLPFVNGFARINPDIPNIIRWEGNGPDKVAVSVDQTFLSIRKLKDPFDPLSDLAEISDLPPIPLIPFFPGSASLVPARPPYTQADLVIFPSFAVPGVETPRVQLPNPIIQSYTLPPGLIPSGTTGLLQITLKRNRGAVVSDFSETVFGIPVQFGPVIIPPVPQVPVTNPGGFPPFFEFPPFFDLNADPLPEPLPVVPLEASAVIAARLPANATATEKSYDHDFDGDGLSNFAEWVFDSDPANASSVPLSPQVVFEVPPTTERRTRDSVSLTPTQSGSWVFKVAKKENTLPALKYCIERSADMNEWKMVSAADLNWKLVETTSEIKVVSRTPELVGGSFFRVCVEQN